MNSNFSRTSASSLSTNVTIIERPCIVFACFHAMMKSVSENRVPWLKRYHGRYLIHIQPFVLFPYSPKYLGQTLVTASCRHSVPRLSCEGDTTLLYDSKTDLRHCQRHPNIKTLLHLLVGVPFRPLLRGYFGAESSS